MEFPKQLPTAEEMITFMEKQRGGPLPDEIKEHLRANHEAFFEKMKVHFNRPFWKKVLHLRLTPRRAK